MKRESLTKELKREEFNFDQLLKVVETEGKKIGELTLINLMQKMIQLLAKVTHYPENALVSFTELIQLNEAENEIFQKASIGETNEIDESLFWQKVFTEIKKLQTKTPYLPFSNLIVNNLILNSLIVDLDNYCARNLEK